MDTYYDLILFLLKINNGITQSMLSKQIIGRLMCCLFRPQLDFEEPKDLTADLTTLSYTLKIQYRDDVLIDPKQDPLRSFINPNFSNLSKFYTLLWEFLRCAYIGRREDHNKFLYHKPGTNYKLTLNEAKLFNFDVGKIEYMFKSIDSNDKRTIRKICKIIAFSAFGSENVSNAAKEYLENLVYEVEVNKKDEISFQLAKFLVKINDEQQITRVDLLLNINLIVQID